LDYHKSIEEYARTKFRLFDIESNLKLIDLDTYKKFNFEEIDSLTTISNNNSAANIFYTIDSCDIKKSTFSIFDKEKNTYQFETSLFPKFNISNLIFAICSTGLSSFKIDSVNNLDFLTLPKGRSDLIDNIEANIIIDYAHNADGFEFFLSSIKDYFRNLVVVFGCGGDRDRSKRSKMLMSAFKFSNDVIFTSDNSRNERFEDILSDALDGSVNRDDITIIENRKEAIIYGSSIIKENDCLVILGKGHEETQEIKGNVMHFSDYEVVDEIYN
jgi:UDP-N-acetylmuramoyl-L-alanyl-D-glutamate--2,6-diaminopimelate ligase